MAGHYFSFGTSSDRDDDGRADVAERDGLLLARDDEGDDNGGDVMHHEDLTMKAKPRLQLSSSACRVQKTRETIYARKQPPRSQSVTLDRHISLQN